MGGFTDAAQPAIAAAGAFPDQGERGGLSDLALTSEQTHALA